MNAKEMAMLLKYKLLRSEFLNRFLSHSRAIDGVVEFKSLLTSE